MEKFQPTGGCGGWGRRWVTRWSGGPWVGSLLLELFILVNLGLFHDDGLVFSCGGCGGASVKVVNFASAWNAERGLSVADDD